MRLAVNIDHIATIREARRARDPQPVAAAILAELAGAEGITVHLRGDRRHINERDVELLREIVRTKLNIEMAATPEMTAIAARIRPDQVTLVLRAPAGAHHAGRAWTWSPPSTSSAGCGHRHAERRPIRVSIVHRTRVGRAGEGRRVGASTAGCPTPIEINTGPYADGPAGRAVRGASRRYGRPPPRPDKDGLEVLAGHA